MAEKSTRQEYITLFTNILTKANNVHKVLMKNRSKLRGTHKRFLAEEAFDTIIRQLSSHHAIVIGRVNESAKKETLLSEPDPIKVPERLKKKGVNTEAVKALASCVSAINKLQDAIHNATVYYVDKTPYIQSNQRLAISRALITTVLNIKAEREHLIPPTKLDGKVTEELQSRIDKLSTMIDERVYLSIVQRAE